MSRIGAAGLLLLGVAGCVHYQARPLVPASNLAAVESRTLGSPELATFLQANHHASEWPPDRWDFRTLTLVGFYYNPDLDVARADWAVARAGLVTAGERPNPNLGVVPGYNSTTPTSVITPWILTLNLDFTIETAGKRGHRLSQAQYVSEATRLAIATAAWQVRSRVRRSLLALCSATETLAMLQKQQDLLTQTLALLERQLEAGAIAPIEITRVRIEVDTLRFSLLDAARQRDDARVQLADALGVGVQALDGITIDFDQFRRVPSDMPEADARRQALLNRPDILGLLAEYAAAQAALQLEIARQYPDIHLGPGYEMDQSDNKWTLGVSLALPLFSRNRGPIAEADARRTQAAARFTALQLHTITEIDRALAGYRAALEKTATADAMAGMLRQQAQSARVLFDAGEISRLDLDLLQLQLAVNERARLEGLVNAHEALGLLEDTIRRPADIAEWVTTTPPRDAAPIKH
jgi:outer membrane protein TolC